MADSSALTFLGISGSTRKASLNRALLQTIAEVMPPEAKVTLWDGLETLPIFNSDLAEPPAVIALKSAIAAADIPKLCPTAAAAKAFMMLCRPFSGNVAVASPLGVISLKRVSPNRGNSISDAFTSASLSIAYVITSPFESLLISATR